MAVVIDIISACGQPHEEWPTLTDDGLTLYSLVQLVQQLTAISLSLCPGIPAY